MEKKARNKVTLYALIIVCILSSATSILSLEGIECQDVVAAIECHSSRYGVPGALYVDNRAQLISLNNAKFPPWDLENELRYKLDVKVMVSCPKAHEEKGRVERRIRLIREMPEQT